MNASAHSGGLNAEGCHNDRKRGSYHCHPGGGASSRSDAAPINTFIASRIAPARASRSQGVFRNRAEARAAEKNARKKPIRGLWSVIMHLAEKQSIPLESGTNER
jgi:hypothetical protein